MLSNTPWYLHLSSHPRQQETPRHFGLWYAGLLAPGLDGLVLGLG